MGDAVPRGTHRKQRTWPACLPSCTPRNRGSRTGTAVAVRERHMAAALDARRFAARARPHGAHAVARPPLAPVAPRTGVRWVSRGRPESPHTQSPRFGACVQAVAEPRRFGARGSRETGHWQHAARGQACLARPYAGNRCGRGGRGSAPRATGAGGTPACRTYPSGRRHAFPL